MRTKAAPRRFQEQFDSREQEGFFRDVAADLADMDAAATNAAADLLALDNRVYALEVLNLLRVAFVVWTWDGTAVTVQASRNCSVSRSGRGLYAISFAANYWASEHYGMAGGGKLASGDTSSALSVSLSKDTAPTATTCTVATSNQDGVLLDPERVTVLFYGLKGS